MTLFGNADSERMVSAEEALPGRSSPVLVPARHAVNGHPLDGPYPQGMELAVFGMGCFWGGEELFWQHKGVYVTAVGYAGGYTPNPTYQEVCTGRTGHTEAILVVYDPSLVRYEELLKLFWESHDPTQGMRQGNDRGTQYRSAIHTFSTAQEKAAKASRTLYQEALRRAGQGEITTEIKADPDFYFAEDQHQQYLAKHPDGYRCHANTGVPYPL